MRLFYFLCKNARAPQDPKKVPLAKPRLPFRLRDKVSQKIDSREQASTIQETLNLITALGKHDFNEQHCQKEIEALRAAHQKQYDEMIALKLENQSEEVPVGNDLRSQHLNKYLKRFPGPK